MYLRQYAWCNGVTARGAKSGKQQHRERDCSATSHVLKARAWLSTFRVNTGFHVHAYGNCWSQGMRRQQDVTFHTAVNGGRHNANQSETSWTSLLTHLKHDKNPPHQTSRRHLSIQVSFLNRFLRAATGSLYRVCKLNADWVEAFSPTQTNTKLPFWKVNCRSVSGQTAQRKIHRRAETSSPSCYAWRRMISPHATTPATALRTNWQIPCNHAHLDKPTVPQLVKKFREFYATRGFITKSTTALHLSLPHTTSTQSTSPHPTVSL